MSPEMINATVTHLNSFLIEENFIDVSDFNVSVIYFRFVTG
ncbi:hypothetical protein LEP1GSC120_0783 [Leptospira santarosai str. 200702252]|nr:hypothetical protein LEP1GSC120_0783 [Leptospira santarosai str. 200702252]